MKKKSILWVAILTPLMIMQSGCIATTSHFYRINFYGIKVNSIHNARDFKITKYSKDRVEFTRNSSVMNSDISAWGNLSSYHGGPIYIDVTNNSKFPIPTNYFGDSCSLVTRDGTVYNLEKPGITIYYDKEYINPNTTASYHFLLPSPIRNIRKEQIEMVVLKLGVIMDTTTIVLKPLPDMEK